MTDDRMRKLAVRTANALAATELVFIEDDKIDALAVALQEFLAAAGLPDAEEECRDR